MGFLAVLLGFVGPIGQFKLLRPSSHFPVPSSPIKLIISHKGGIEHVLDTWVALLRAHIEDDRSCYRSERGRDVASDHNLISSLFPLLSASRFILYCAHR